MSDINQYILKDYRKIYCLFHTAYFLHIDSILDFGGSFSRSAMFSRRYWTSWTEYIDIPQKTRFDSYDMFETCSFPIFNQVYDHIYHDLEEVLKQHYGIVAFIDIVPFLDTEVMLDILALFAPCCPLLLIQFPCGSDFPLHKLHRFGQCSQGDFANYDIIIIQTGAH